MRTRERNKAKKRKRKMATQQAFFGKNCRFATPKRRFSTRAFSLHPLITLGECLFATRLSASRSARRQGDRGRRSQYRVWPEVGVPKHESPIRKIRSTSGCSGSPLRVHRTARIHVLGRFLRLPLFLVVFVFVFFIFVCHGNKRRAQSLPIPICWALSHTR